jgi:pyruvate,orthophosphate dikinase
MATRWVYSFGDLDDLEAGLDGGWDAVRALLGGKGANLADMTRLGVPVPPGFTVTTAACNVFLAQDETLPDGLWAQSLEAIEAMEKQTDRRFGGAGNPLLLSSRSGSKISMPGMMDTILNIGLNDEVAEALVASTGDERFVYDLYRRLVQMLGAVVLGVPDDLFESVLKARREARGARLDADLTGPDWRWVVENFKGIVKNFTGEDFPSDPYEQLRLAIVAVFKSWNSRRAIDYRNASGIPHDLGTAVNVQAMVFGNLGPDSGTGVAMSRNASTGAPELEGDFLLNAQGEDVVAGIRKTQPLSDLERLMPTIYEQFEGIARRLERHYRNMQDMEFTIERGRLWLLQTRDGKRTAQAEVRIATDMVDEGLIDKQEAVRRVKPEQVDFFLHPQLDPAATESTPPVAKGLNVSPGAAVGVVAFDADTAKRWASEGRAVIMVRPETKPDDVHGMLAAKGILTARGGRTSHAALVARQFGKPAVVGVEALEIDLDSREMTIESESIKEGDWISIDGTNGRVYVGQLETQIPDLKSPHLLKVLGWADEIRRLGVRANADYPRDAERAREYGAQGIGLCRTEHMFFETERLTIVRRMILAKSVTERNEAIAELLSYQRSDFVGLFRAMNGLPVIVRLLDPPLHEFLPAYDELLQDVADLKMRIQHMHTMSEVDAALDEVAVKRDYLARVETLRETNPMLGMRGVRLGILIPELTRMQVRAIMEAACACAREGVDVRPEVMIPLTGHVNELALQRGVLEEEARAVLSEQGADIDYKFGTMIELPRAALTAGEMDYVKKEILPDNPFETIDPNGVGRLIEMAVTEGRATRPDLTVGICGEHGGDPRSIALCHRLGLDYVSCSPFRVPIARLAAAHAALADGET